MGTLGFGTVRLGTLGLGLLFKTASGDAIDEAEVHGDLAKSRTHQVTHPT